MPDTDIAHLTDRFMRRIHATLNANAATFDHHRIGPSGGILLLTLAEIAPARMNDLVREMARDKSQMTRAVNALEAKGLLEREDDPQDARACVLRLTPEGVATVQTLQGAVADALSDILAPLSVDERETLRGLLRRI